MRGNGRPTRPTCINSILPRPGSRILQSECAARAVPTVLKLGGSYAFSPFLKSWIDAVKDCAGRVVLVPGGGPFAETVRAAQPKMGFDDRAAHEMAVLAMDQYGCALAHLGAGWRRAASAAAIRDVLREGGAGLVADAQMMRDAKDIPWSWDVTSDSLAAWLAGRLGAERVLLIKQPSRRRATCGRRISWRMESSTRLFRAS